MKSALGAMNKRYSARSYMEKPVENEKLQKLKEAMAATRKGPLGSDVRLDIVDATGYEPAEMKKLGTYGVIKGPRLFLAGTVAKGETALEDFGYCMEKLILEATDLGLGTCWLGGMLNRSTFAQKLCAGENEVIPAVTPIGYAAEKPSMTESLMRMFIGAKKRKPASELFFDRSVKSPLQMSSCGEYSRVLEAVRSGPSASNKQPWRIILGEDKNWYLYLDEDRKYNSSIQDIKIQYLDMGIAMCHFELAAAELGLGGGWRRQDPGLDAGELKYVVSWAG